MSNSAVAGSNFKVFGERGSGAKKVPGDRGNGGLVTVATFRSWRDSQAATPQPLTRGTLGRERGDATGILDGSSGVDFGKI
jgi:hypothetical protein